MLSFTMSRLGVLTHVHIEKRTLEAGESVNRGSWSVGHHFETRLVYIQPGM